MKGTRSYRAAAAVFVTLAFVACSGGLGSIPRSLSGGSPAKTGARSAPRHRASWNLGTTQALVTGVMLQPLTISVSGGVATAGLYGTTRCSASSGSNPCPNIAFTASPPSWSSAADSTMTFSAASLPTTCAAPSGAPTPSPGFTPGCYVVAYEGGVGPYDIQGPGTQNGGSLDFASNPNALNFNGGNTGYNFFLAWVTDIGAAPPPPTPSPVPTATYIATATPSPTPAPGATSCATVSPTATPGWGGEDDVVHRNDDGGDDGGGGGGTSCTPAPCATPSDGGEGGDGGWSGDGARRRNHHDGGHGHHHHHRGSGDGTCSTAIPSPTPSPTPTPAGF